jgi:WD40 repeat protein
MAEVTHEMDSAPPEEAGPREYDAFLSYAHRDRQVTAAIQKGLHQIGRRAGQLRALRVFRDDTNLTANPDLWGKITEALDNSRFLIVVLSPQSAASHWVNEEVSYWLQHRGHEQLMLMLAEGHLAWDGKNKRFDPEQSDAATPVLSEPGSLRAEPLYIDVSEDEPWDVRDRTFRDKLTSLAAPIHGKPKDQLAGDDVREQRRFRRLRRAAIAGLAVLTVVAVVAAVIAVAQRQEAIKRLHDAVVAKLSAEGASMLAGSTPGGDVRALQELLAANAIEANGVPILNAQIARFTTQKIINPGSNPHALAYSPDGRRIVTGDDDGTVRQWDPATGKPVGALMKGPTNNLSAIAYTPDGHTIASAGMDGTMRLWNADTGAAINPDPKRGNALMSITVSPDGKKILTAGANDTLEGWDASGHLRATGQILDDPSALLTGVTFDRSGNLLAVSGMNGGIAIYDTLDTFKPHIPPIVVRDLVGTPAPVQQIAFSPDGHTIAAPGLDLQLWNADTGTLIRTIQPRPTGRAEVETVAFSPDGHRIATGRSDGAVQLWDPDTGAQLGPTLIGHTGRMTGLAFSPDGRQIASASLDGTVRLWSATVGQAMQGPHAVEVIAQVAFSPDGQRVAASGDTGVQQWDVSSGRPLTLFTRSGTGGMWFGYVNGGRMVAASAADGTVQVWDTTSGQLAQPPAHIHIGPRNISGFAFSPDGRTIASVEADDGTVQVWDVATGRALGQPMTVSNVNGRSIGFSPDGRRLVAGYTDGLRMWNANTTQLDGTVMPNRPNFDPVYAVAFSRDGTSVGAGRATGPVELWDPATHNQLPHSPLRGHTGQLVTVAFGPAHQLASVGFDATLRLWDTSTGAPTASPLTMPDIVTGVALSPDGRLVASATVRGTVMLSPAIADSSQLCDKLSTNMSHKQWRDWVSPGIGYITVCPGLPVAPD